MFVAALDHPKLSFEVACFPPSPPACLLFWGGERASEQCEFCGPIARTWRTRQKHLSDRRKRSLLSFFFGFLIKPISDHPTVMIPTWRRRQRQTPTIYIPRAIGRQKLRACLMMDNADSKDGKRVPSPPLSMAHHPVV